VSCVKKIPREGTQTFISELLEINCFAQFVRVHGSWC